MFAIFYKCCRKKIARNLDISVENPAHTVFFVTNCKAKDVGIAKDLSFRAASK
jgi:hypothetical protein